MLIAFVALNLGRAKTAAIKKGYFLWVILLFITNGLYGVLMDAQQRMIPNERNEMIIVTYGTLGIISIAYFLIHRENIGKAFHMGFQPAIYAVSSSICAAFAVFLLMILLQYVPSYILFTVNNGSILVLSALLSAFILKEKPTRMTIAGVVLSAISIVMLSL